MMIKNYTEFGLDMDLEGENLTMRIICRPYGISLPKSIAIGMPELHCSSRDLLQSNPNDLSKIGLSLYQSFFVEAVKSGWQQHFSKRTEEEGVRVAISSDSNKIYSYVWEILCKQDYPIADFLALDPRTPVVRTPRAGTEVYLRELHYPLQLLIVLFSPRFTEKISREYTESIFKVLSEAKAKGHIEYDCLGFDDPIEADFSNLQTYLSGEKQYDIVHIIGHGILEIGLEGIVAFVKNDGKRQDVPASDLANLFRSRRVMLVVLQSCQSGSIDPDAANFSSVAQHLVASGVPAVIAMQESIDQDVAGKFIERFYERWLEGNCPLEDALTQARQNIKCDFSDRPASWAIPALYMSPGVSLSAKEKTKSLDFEKSSRILEAAIKSDMQFEEKSAVVILIRTPESQGLRDMIRAKPDEYEMAPDDVGKGNKFNVSFPNHERIRKDNDKTLRIIIETDDFKVDQTEREIQISPFEDSMLYWAMVKPIKKGIARLLIRIVDINDGRLIDLANMRLATRVHPVDNNSFEYVYRVKDLKIIESQQLLNSGSAYMQREMYGEAIQCYNKAIETDPQYAKAWNYKGDALAFFGRYDEAAQVYDKAIELEPKDVAAWNNKGNVLANMMMYDEAIAAYDKAIEIDMLYARAWNNKGNVMALTFRYDEAINAYDKAIEIDQQYAGAWNNKGFTFSQLGRNDDALKAYDMVVDLDPSFASAWNGKGIVLTHMNMHDEAIKAFDEAIKLDPEYSDAWTNESIAFQKQGKWKDAIEVSRRTIEKSLQKASILVKEYNIIAGFAPDYSKAYSARSHQIKLLHEEDWRSLDFLKYSPYDKFSASNVWSYQSDEGIKHELRGAYYPNYAMDIGRQDEYAGISSAIHAGRMDAFAANPLIRVSFASPTLVSDWANLTTVFGKGKLR